MSFRGTETTKSFFQNWEHRCQVRIIRGWQGCWWSDSIRNSYVLNCEGMTNFVFRPSVTPLEGETLTEQKGLENGGKEGARWIRWCLWQKYSLFSSSSQTWATEDSHNIHSLQGEVIPLQGAHTVGGSLAWGNMNCPQGRPCPSQCHNTVFIHKIKFRDQQYKKRDKHTKTGEEMINTHPPNLSISQ